MKKDNIESKKYFVLEITEVSQKLVVIAEDDNIKTLDDARNKVKEKYKRNEITLYPCDVKEATVEPFQYSHPTDVAEVVADYVENEEYGSRFLNTMNKLLDEGIGLKEKIEWQKT